VNPHEADWKSHESFGMVQFNRVSSSPPKIFFGSSVRSGHYIELTIHSAKKVQDGSHISYFADRQIINVRLSPNQFSELLTTMNVGNGVPCTLQRIQGETIEDCTDEDDIRELHKQDFRKQIYTATKDVEEAITEVEKVVDISKASFGIGKRKELLKSLKHVLMILKSNLPYYHSQFDEAVDKTLAEAKAELDSFTGNLITKLGLDSLETLKAIQATKPDLPELGMKE